MTHPILRHQVPKGVAAATVDVRSPRFPDDDPAAPVYTVKVPTRRDRIEYRASLTAAGLRWPGDAQLIECIRADLKANAQGWPALIETVDAFEAQKQAVAAHALETAVELLKIDGDEARLAHLTARHDDDAAPSVDPDLAGEFAQIEADVRRHCAAFRELEADRRRYSELSPLLAAGMFLRGWSGLDAPFRRDGDLVPDELLDLVPDPDLAAINGKVIELMGVGEIAAKNFASPSASSSNRSNSTTGGKRRTAPRGNSTGSSSGSTRRTRSTGAG